jgi:hypothetical protein
MGGTGWSYEDVIPLLEQAEEYSGPHADRRYRADGRSRKLTLGSYPGLDLKAARELAREALRKVAGGDDPAAEKKAARRAPTSAHGDIAHVAKTFLERYAKPNCREASWRETERIMTREIIPAWSGRRLSSITRPDVHALLDAIADRGSPVMANRVLAAIRRLFNCATERDLIAVSPCENVKARPRKQAGIECYRT